ncbi:hypothetical protein SteCoe_21356 [Stentor coeruleus]|uniref:Uncharacterized protein n=1 Tax=Stentor coeruleus TaxID=5963 RepID=A0A1R2BPR0_9CILI|nr:hypothetical protein SteCoe_21356 [Stentor coeruleus]
MDTLKNFKLKYLNLLAKRIILLALNTWKIKLLIFKGPINTTGKKILDTCLVSEPKFISIVPTNSKIIHRNTYSYTENIDFISLLQSPQLKSNSRSPSPTPFSLFNEIKCSLQNKAETKDLNAQKCSEKLGDSKRKLVNSSSAILLRKRRITAHEGELAIVSSKTERQHGYKINIVGIESN